MPSFSENFEPLIPQKPSVDQAPEIIASSPRPFPSRRAPRSKREGPRPCERPLLDFFQSFIVSPTSSYSSLQSLLCQHGRLHAFVLVISALIINHVRRVLIPWLGQFFFYHPVDDLKLARTVPYYLLEIESLHFTWFQLLGWLTMVVILNLLLGGLRSVLVFRAQAWSMSPDKKASRGREKVSTDLMLVGYLVLVTMGIEYAFCAAAWALGILYSYQTLALDTFTTSETSAASHKFLVRLATTHGYRKLPVQLALVLYVVARSVVPSLNKSLLGLMHRKPSLAVVMGGACLAAVHVIRYSSRYFVAIEMSDLIVTWAQLTVATALCVFC